METKTLTSEESLLIIQQMISTAKKERKDDGKGWIVWGWLLLAAPAFTCWCCVGGLYYSLDIAGKKFK